MSRAARNRWKPKARTVSRHFSRTPAQPDTSCISLASARSGGSGGEDARRQASTVESVLPHFLLDKTMRSARRRRHETRDVAAAAGSATKDSVECACSGLHRHGRHRSLSLRHEAEAAGQRRLHADPERHSGYRGARQPALHLRREARHADLHRFVDAASTRAARSSACFPRKGRSPWAATPIWSSTIPRIAASSPRQNAARQNDYNGFEGFESKGGPSVVTVRGKVQVRDGIRRRTRAREAAEARTGILLETMALDPKRTIAELKELRELTSTTTARNAWPGRTPG